MCFPAFLFAPPTPPPLGVESAPEPCVAWETWNGQIHVQTPPDVCVAKRADPLTQWNCASLVQKIRPLRTLQIKDDDQFLNRLESQLRYSPTSTYWVPRRCGLCILALALHHASSTGRRASVLFYLYIFRFPVPPVSVPSCISTLILVY